MNNPNPSARTRLFVKDQTNRIANELIYRDCLGVRIDAEFGRGVGSSYLGPMNQRAADKMVDWLRRGGDITVEFNPTFGSHLRRRVQESGPI